MNLQLSPDFKRTTEVVAGDLEGLQETTLKPTVFELILVQIENQTLLMAAPVNPDHLRFKNN